MKLMALKQDGVNYVLCAKQGNKIEDAVLHTQVMYFRIFLFKNRVRVSNPPRLTYTQALVAYIPRLKGFHFVNPHLKLIHWVHFKKLSLLSSICIVNTLKVPNFHKTIGTNCHEFSLIHEELLYHANVTRLSTFLGNLHLN